MEIIEFLKAVLFGVVEGITEWLPVSSTGHMILVDQFVKLQVTDEFYKMFEVVIQLGAIMAVVLLYFKKLVAFGDGALKMWVNIIVACIPAAIIGIAFDDKIDELFYHPIPVALALIIVGVIFIVVENWNKGRTPSINSIQEITLKTAFIIGLFQVVAAVFPGTSRSGATIIGALLIGVSRSVAAEFTFFLAIPVMFGASLLKGVKYVTSGVACSGSELAILGIGTVVSFLVSILVISFLMSYIKKHDFKVFGWYRIVLGILVLLLIR